MKIITISGLDGSGKSTQIEMLKNYLESQGKRVFYFHAIEFGIATKITNFKNNYCLLCKLIGRCCVKKPVKSVTKANWLQIQLRKLFLKIDIWRFGKLRNKLLTSGYDYILSDRYFYDSVVNIEYLERSKKSEFNSEASGLNSDFFPANSAIYLQTSPENIMSRERKPDQGLEYLQKKKELYDAKTNTWNWKVIDGNREKDVIFEEIKKYA